MEEYWILWENMRFVSKEGDLAIEMYELCCNTFRLMVKAIVILQSKHF